jgi:hypothetical protein
MDIAACLLLLTCVRYPLSASADLASKRAAGPPPKAPTSRDRAVAWAAGTFAPGGGLLPTLRASRSTSPQVRRGAGDSGASDAALWEAAM